MKELIHWMAVSWLALILSGPAIATEEADFEFQKRLDAVLYEKERGGDLEGALAGYRAIEADILAMNTEPGQPGYADQQKVLAYTLLRQGNILRQLDREAEALALAERELAAARASGDPLTEARTAFSYGASLVASGRTESGLEKLERARNLFEAGEGQDFQQGLGWYWIIRADLAQAGYAAAEPTEIANFANRALEALEPIENWAGVARAHAARAKAREAMGDKEGAAADRAEEKRFNAMVKKPEDG